MADDPARSPDQSTHPPDDVSGSFSRMSFGDHLDELRIRMIRALVGAMIGTIVCLIFGKWILEVIFAPLLVVQYRNELPPQLQVLAPTAAFTAYLKIGVLSGLIISMPWVLYQIWAFVASGLFTHERRFVKMLIPASIGLFVVGVLFLYWIVLPVVLHFFVSFNKGFSAHDLTPTPFQQLLLPEAETPPASMQDVQPVKLPILTEDPLNPDEGEMWVNAVTRRFLCNTPSGIWSVALEPGGSSPVMRSQFAIDFYISFVLILALAFGIAFETPIVVFFLAWTGIVSTAAMIRGRRYVLLGTVVAAAMLTPPDVISQILLAGPMYLLFELGILVARTVQRKPASRAAG